MFNSFLDGSKPSIESTAVANATGLAVPSNGLLYPPASVEDIPFVTRPKSEGGVATAKRDLQPGELLDGEGGYTVWGKLLPASTSLQLGGLPLGLAHNVKLVRPVKKGQSLSWADVAMDTGTHACQVRREMEQMSAGVKK